MVRIILDVETAEEPHATVFNRVLYKLTRDELIHNASFQELAGDESASRNDALLKAQVIGWMRDKEVSVVSVASYLGMAISSTKNLLYTKSLPICERRAEQLRAMMKDAGWSNQCRRA